MDPAHKEPYDYIVAPRWRHWSLPYFVGGVWIFGFFGIEIFTHVGVHVWVCVRVCEVYVYVGAAAFVCVYVCLYVVDTHLLFSCISILILRLAWVDAELYIFMLLMPYFGIDPKTSFSAAPKKISSVLNYFPLKRWISFDLSILFNLMRAPFFSLSLFLSIISSVRLCGFPYFYFIIVKFLVQYKQP